MQLLWLWKDCKDAKIYLAEQDLVWEEKEHTIWKEKNWRSVEQIIL